MPSLPLQKAVFAVIMAAIFYVAFLPPILLLAVAVHFLSWTIWWHLALLPLLVFIGATITIQSLTLLPAALVQIFSIWYEPGTYRYDFRSPQAFRWMVYCSLYTPGRKILEIVPMARTKRAYYRLLGMTIGQNSLVGGVVKDPCLTTFGRNVTMGEYAIIYGHIHNMQEGTIMMDKVTVGDNCVIGAGAIIMPGAVLEDDVVVAAGALVTKGQVLTKGKTYGGIPAKELVRASRPLPSP